MTARGAAPPLAALLATPLAALLAVLLAVPASAGQGPAPPADDALAGSRVSIRLSGGLGPWRAIRYEAFDRGGVAVVVHARELAGSAEASLQTALLTPAEYRALWRALTEADALALPRPGRPLLPGGPTAHLEIVHGERSLSLSVPDPHTQPDPRFAAVLAAVARVVQERAGAIPFRDGFHPPARVGWLDLSSAPAAAVAIDGRATGERTPLERYPLPAGRHDLTLRSEAHGLERTYDFRIVPGMTTRLDLDLR